MIGFEKRLPITAFVASCNEAHLLERCLQGLSFCNEIYVINLASTDNTSVIAEQYGAKVLQYPRYSIIEEAHVHALPLATNNWLLLTDPDEVIDIKLASKITSLFSSKEIEKYSAVRVPMQYYFKENPLKGTIWGGENNCRFLFKKKDIQLSNLVHEGIRLAENSKVLQLNRECTDMVVHHYWITSYQSFIEKVNRYIAKEGEKMYEDGIRYSLPKQLKNSLGAFKNCFITSKGYKDGLVGVILSFIWSYYVFYSWVSLFHYPKKRTRFASE